MRRPSIRRSPKAVRGGATTRTLSGTLALVAAASLLGIPAANARILPDHTTGAGKSSSGATVNSKAAANKGSVAAQATLTCNPVEGFSRVESGSLFKVRDAAPLGGANTMTQTASPVGSGWKPGTFAWVGSGGGGVVYALKWNGDILWYRWTGAGWGTGSGRVIGNGFIPRTRIINIALGTDGRLYVVKTTGQLVMFRHEGRLTGTATWSNGNGWLIGSGWTGNEIIVPIGDGTVYRQYQGMLYWYRHTDPTAGAVTWQPRKTVGSGWNFYDVLSAGGGLLYATSGGDSKVYTYQHNDPVGGTNSWAASRGVEKITILSDSYGITVDPYACTRA